MRPRSIVLFERLVLLSIVLGIISALLVSDKTQAALDAQGTPMGTGTLYTVQAIGILLYLVLLYFISRKASPVAKWIYVVLAVIGLVMGLVGISATLAFGALPAAIAIAQYAITVVTIWLLFRPDSNAWFNDGRAEGDPANRV